MTTALADDIGSASVKVNGAGWYSVTVSNQDGHAAVPFMVREMRADTLPSPDADASSVKVPMMELANAEALRINRSISLWHELKRRQCHLPVRIMTGWNTSHYRLALGAGNTLTGQLATISDKGMVGAGAGNNVLVYRDGRLVYRTVSDDLGTFTIADVNPGVYGLVTVGPAGYSAFAFEAQDNASTTKTLSTKRDYNPCFDINL